MPSYGITPADGRGPVLKLDTQPDALTAWPLLTGDQHDSVPATPVSTSTGTVFYARPFENGRAIPGGRRLMQKLGKPTFDVRKFLASAGRGRELLELHEDQILFSQGKAADSVIYLQSGRAKLIVGSSNGKEATITYITPGDFVGEESLAIVGALHTSTATAITHCRALRIERGEMLRALHEEQPLAVVFTAFLLARGMRIQSDLVDQLFDSSEKRLARALLLMSGLGKTGEIESLPLEITEERLAEMIGAPRSAVRFFMNRFRELGFIRYDGQIRVHQSLLDTILHDRLPGNNTATPEIVHPAR